MADSDSRVGEMPSKLAQLQEIIKQSRTDEEQQAVKTRRLVHFLAFFVAGAVATAAHYFVSSRPDGAVHAGKGPLVAEAPPGK